MSSLWRAEWLKIRNFRPFWVVFWLYPVCLGGMLAVALWGQGRAQDLAERAGQAQTLADNLPFAFPQVWHNASYLASWLHLIPAVLLILNVTNEFTFRTHRQNLLEGWSRAMFLLSKLVLALAISLYCTAITLAVTVVCGAYSGTAPSLEGSSYLGLFFLQGAVYQVFALLLAFMIRRGALALAAFFLYTMMLEGMVAFFVNLKWEGYGSYLPIKVANGLLPMPYLRENVPQAAKQLFAGPGPETLLVAAGVYLLLFLTIMGVRFHREDL